MNEVIELAKQLIAIESVTPNDNGCQTLINDWLQPLGFALQSVDREDVSNLWARLGNEGPLLVFSGHTDVVPSGPLEKWDTPPFTPIIKGDYLYGRGAADMKSAIAAMLVATQRFVNETATFKGSIAFAITSDEEGPSQHGSKAIVKWLQQQQIQPDYCLIGEASSEQTLGDIIKVGRRGSLHGHLIIQGKQGHIAYPDRAVNAIQIAQPVIEALYQQQWDQGCEHFSPTSFQISNCHAGVGAKNVIPGEITLDFNFRYCPASTAESLQQKVISLLDGFDLHYHIEWSVGALPFDSPNGKLRQAVSEATQLITGVTPQASTIGGTSDGRFFAPLGCEIVELGPINESIHQVNEHINIKDLTQLAEIYFNVLKLIFSEQ